MFLKKGNLPADNLKIPFTRSKCQVTHNVIKFKSSMKRKITYNLGQVNKHKRLQLEQSALNLLICLLKVTKTEILYILMQ